VLPKILAGDGVQAYIFSQFFFMKGEKSGGDNLRLYVLSSISYFSVILYNLSVSSDYFVDIHLVF
jgi:hypothetical protein